MLLEGSCHCGAIRFRVESPEPYPFMRCYCSICRKTAGGGGYAVNLGALSGTLEVEGEDNLSVYNAKLYDRGDAGEVPASEAERNFCGLCGSFLCLFSPSYPERDHIMLDYAAPWCEVPSAPAERRFPEYPDESLADWHRRHGLRDDPANG